MPLKQESLTPWAPHLTAAPLTERAAPDTLIIAANGTRTCIGGWQAHYSGMRPGQNYMAYWDVEFTGLDHPRNALRCLAYWDELPPNQAGSWGAKWEYLLPQRTGERSIRFSRILKAPDEAASLTLRCAFRWSTKGRTVWSLPQVNAVSDLAHPRRPIQVCVVTGHIYSRRERTLATIQDNLGFYSRLCETACKGKPDLVLLPEWSLQWQLPGNPLDLAVPAPGPETDVFAQIARRHQVRIVLPILERDGDAVYNSALLISPQGSIDGKYHKVHLAVGSETNSGIRPGDSFPVFDTEIGRIGCNICMDSSAAESSRLIGLNGADFLLLPIMGDHRANRWSRGEPIFNESRWKAIMRARALDNQLCMVVARNTAWGSCIVDRKGDILAWNEGDQDYIRATVPLEDDYRAANGGCFREINWMQRRPHLYPSFTDEDNIGPLKLR